jgi:hypothetical protein
MRGLTDGRARTAASGGSSTPFMGPSLDGADSDWGPATRLNESDAETA